MFAEGQSPGRMGNRHPSIAPYDTFDTADGPLVLAVGNDEQWRRLCEVLGLQALASDSRFATNGARVEHYDTLESLLAPVLAQRTRAEWTAVLVGASVPCGPVRSVAEALADPQLQAREMLVRAMHATASDLTLLGVPIKLSNTPGSVRTAPPTLGQHTEAVLAELGLNLGEGG